MSSFFRAFLERARHAPSLPAVIHSSASPGVTTYGELLALAEGYAVSLTTLTPRRTLVPVFAGKSADSIALSLGCLAAGRPFAWLNKRLRAPQIDEIVRATNTEFVVTDAPGLTALGPTIRTNPGLAKLRWLGLADRTRAGRADSLMRVMERLTQAVNARTISPIRDDHRVSLDGVDADALGCCLFTSGSTGRQKGVLVAEGDLSARAESEADWYGLGPGDRLLSILPFSFDVGLNQLMSALIAGACLVIEESWLPKDLVDTIAEQNVSGISGVPAVWRDLLASGLCLDRDGPHRSLRYLTISGGSLSVAEQGCLQDSVQGLAIFKTYGQTETFRSASLRPEELAERPGSVGRAYVGTRLLVLDDAAKACVPGQVGEVVHAGLGTMIGYLGELSSKEKVRTLPADLGGGRAVFTGDYGYLDDEGYLFLKGRRDAMVKIAGHRVYPEEVADQLRVLDGLREAEVIALPEDAADPQLVAFAVSSDGTVSTAAAVRRAAAQRLPAHMLPSDVVFLSKMPRLPNGKVDHLALDALARRRGIDHL